MNSALISGRNKGEDLEVGPISVVPNLFGLRAAFSKLEGKRATFS
jgi:hypothetical protein